MKIKTVISWALRLLTAFVLLQTLYFKFTGQPESVELFTKLGAEPWGRYGSGIVELVASVLLLMPQTAILGALLGIGTMLGAIASHFLVLGIESQGDGGQLFGLAIIVLVCCIGIAGLHYEDLAKFKNELLPNVKH